MIGVLRTAVVLAVIGLILTITVQARIDPSKRCLKPNEIYKSCGTACPLTCEDVRNSNTAKPCTLQCVAGCFCAKDYVRENDDKNSPCVKETECDSKA